MATSPSAVVDPTTRSKGGKSGSNIKTEPFEHLIQHIKQYDPMLYEALKRASYQITQTGNTVTNIISAPPPSGIAIYNRTLDINNTTVGTDIAHRVPVQAVGTLYRVVGVLRLSIGADLTVEVVKNGTAIITITIPSATAPGTPVVTTPGSPVPMVVDDVLSWNITASDGSMDDDGVASVTVEWK